MAASREKDSKSLQPVTTSESPLHMSNPTSLFDSTMTISQTMSESQADDFVHVAVKDPPHTSLTTEKTHVATGISAGHTTANTTITAATSSLIGCSKQRIFKVIVIGDSNVGKTCLTFRFCSGRFPEKTEATIGVDFREKNLDVGGEAIKLQIWDTAGQERFRKSMVQHYYRNVHAVVFVYDVTKQSSFDNLPSWIEECNTNNLGPDIPRILVGNKCDCDDEIEVVTNVAQCFADRHQMPLFETSAKDNSSADHVESIFLTIAHKLKNCRPMMTSASLTPLSPSGPSSSFSPTGAASRISSRVNIRQSSSRSDMFARPPPEVSTCQC